MELAHYIERRRRAVGESLSGFARRAELSQQTVYDVLSGKGCTMTTAYLIVTASQAEPAPRGGTVGYEDLVPRHVRRGRRRRTAAGAARQRP